MVRPRPPAVPESLSPNPRPYRARLIALSPHCVAHPTGRQAFGRGGHCALPASAGNAAQRPARTLPGLARSAGSISSLARTRRARGVESDQGDALNPNERCSMPPRSIPSVTASFKTSARQSRANPNHLWRYSGCSLKLQTMTALTRAGGVPACPAPQRTESECSGVTAYSGRASSCFKNRLRTGPARPASDQRRPTAAGRGRRPCHQGRE